MSQRTISLRRVMAGETTPLTGFPGVFNETVSGREWNTSSNSLAATEFHQTVGASA